MFNNTHTSIFNNNSLIQHPKRNIKFKRLVAHVIDNSDDKTEDNKIEMILEEPSIYDIYENKEEFNYEVNNDNIVLDTKHNELKKSNSIKMYDICKKIVMDKKFSKPI